MEEFVRLVTTGFSYQLLVHSLDSWILMRLAAWKRTVKFVRVLQALVDGIFVTLGLALMESDRKKRKWFRKD
jgi:hypothetical protein